MKILALEFSSPQRSVAVLHPPAKAGIGREQPASPSEVVQTGEHSTRMLGMIETALRQAQLEREQIDCLAIGLGPGSYNGIRAAIALAQGWELASPPNRLKLLGISSVECLAAQAQADGLRGRMAVVIDAQRNELYLAEYEIDAKRWAQTTPLRLATIAEALKRQNAGAQLIGPEVTKWFPGSRVLFPRAATLAQLADQRTDFISAENLEPIYLRETTFVKAPPPRWGV
jgi:tRNA threonylcarbamoyl adenosine modification protein YeaZ